MLAAKVVGQASRLSFPRQARRLSCRRRARRLACFRLLVALFVAIPGAAQAAGLAYNDDFTVLAPDQALADEVLARAADFRKQAAKEWLGEELPPSVGPAIINVAISDAEDRGFTWLVDSPRRKFHKIWLTTSRQKALGSTLGHEITHVVLATRFPNRMPEWTKEGAASLGDDAQRAATRRQIIQWYAQTGNWPDLKTVLDAQTLAADDQAAYSVAASLTEFLLSRGDKAKLLDFAVAGAEEGWDTALRQHYGFASVRELEAAWRAWATQGKP